MTDQYNDALCAFAMFLDQVRAQFSDNERVTFSEAYPLWKDGRTVQEAVEEISSERSVLLDLEEGA